MFKKINSRTIVINEQPTEAFLVRIGCRKVAISNIEQLVDLLKEYFKNPEKVEAHWYESLREEVEQIRPNVQAHVEWYENEQVREASKKPTSTYT